MEIQPIVVETVQEGANESRKFDLAVGQTVSITWPEDSLTYTLPAGKTKASIRVSISIEVE